MNRRKFLAASAALTAAAMVPGAALSALSPPIRRPLHAAMDLAYGPDRLVWFCSNPHGESWVESFTDVELPLSPTGMEYKFDYGDAESGFTVIDVMARDQFGQKRVVEVVLRGGNVFRANRIRAHRLEDWHVVEVDGIPVSKQPFG